LEKIYIQHSHLQDQFYYKIGNGKRVVMLVHGFAENAEIFNLILPIFNDNYTVLLPNLPGTTFTQVLENDKSIIALADYCKAILDQELCFKPITYIGHSMGGYIGIAFYNKYPSLVRGLSFINSHVFADEPERKQKRDQGIAIIQGGGKLNFIKTLISSLYHQQYYNLEWQERHYKQALSLSEDAIIYYYSAMRDRPSYTNTLSEAQIPVQFIIGSNDPTLGYDQFIEQSYLAKTTFIHKISNCGHMSQLEAPDKVKDFLQSFNDYCFSN
jgi:pimeloyl-ACP methyl ester carboxylesterase